MRTENLSQVSPLERLCRDQDDEKRRVEKRKGADLRRSRDCSAQYDSR